MSGWGDHFHRGVNAAVTHLDDIVLFSKCVYNRMMASGELCLSCLILNMLDYSGGAPFLNAQDVEERLFCRVVCCVRVAEYLLQGDTVG
jgi:hypothetical protein